MASSPGTSPIGDQIEGQVVNDRHRVMRTGEFPFPVLAEGKESRQLVWVRHHANYMARRGLLDYVRAISVMIRGAIVNIMIGLPFLILTALGVAALSVYGWGFRAAAGLIILAMAWVVLSPIGERLWAVVRIRNTIALGTNSSVAIRDRLERAFGAIVILIVVAAVFESLSFFLDDFHFWTREQPRDGRAIASIATFSLAFLSGASRLLPRLGGKLLKVAILVVGILGLVSPLLVVMFMADYLVYTGPTEAAAAGVAIAGLALGLIVVLGLAVAMVARAISRTTGAVGLLVAVLLMLVLVDPAASAVDAVGERQESLDTNLAELDLSLNSVPQLRFVDVGDDGISVPQVSDEEYRRREVEFRRLAQNTADRPLPELSSLVEFLDGRGDEAAFVALTLSELGPDVASGDALLERFPALGWTASSLPGIACLLETVAVTDGYYTDDGELAEGLINDLCLGEAVNDIGTTEAMIDELDVLDSRLFFVTPILEAHAQGPVELVESVLTVFDEEIISENLSPERSLRGRYPELATEFPDTFRVAEAELRDLGRLLREVRIEANRVAIFSAQYPSLREDGEGLRRGQLAASAIFAVMLAALLWAYVWIAVDPNRTSLHRLYRDRLAMAFLVGADTKGDVDVEEDLDLGELSRHEARSTAPYHLVNAAVNLQRSKNINLHDRKSDFFVFSKRFVGSERTGYCRSETMERAFPEMSLSTAMAVSGAAASPAMGRMTQPALVALMTILNIRLGFWLPNPGELEETIGYEPKPGKVNQPSLAADRTPGFNFGHVQSAEKMEIERRWQELGAIGGDRSLEGGLLGLACSGGGIRSATLNIGIAQALHQAGVFTHVDYLSTVSGGGFFGSSVSSAMRSREPTRTSIKGTISARHHGDKLEVTIDPGNAPGSDGEAPEVRVFGNDATLCAEADPKHTALVKAGTRLLDLGDPDVIARGREVASRERRWWRRDHDASPFSVQFRWRAKPTSLLREFAGKLDENSRWVNVSDGGHIENLGVFELLRRRCRFIIVGDAEFDPSHEFGGLTTVMRAARLELDTRLVIDLDPLRPDDQGFCAQHWAVGRIHYPDAEPGFLLYLKSSLTGDEDEDLVGYQVKNPEFPHQSTADQFFDEGQFEAYRRLGYSIAKGVLGRHPRFKEYLATGRDECPQIPFADVEAWFTALEAHD